MCYTKFKRYTFAPTWCVLPLVACSLSITGDERLEPIYWFQQVDRQSTALKDMKHEIQEPKDEMQGMKDHTEELIEENVKAKDTMKELKDEMKDMTGMVVELVEQNKKMFWKENQ